MKPNAILYLPDDNAYHELMQEAEQLAHFGGWEVNLLTGEVKWSSEMFNMLGYNPSTAKATFGNFIKKVHKDDIVYIKKNLERLISRPSNETYDFRVIDRTDGSVKYLRTGIVAKRDNSGKAVKLTGFSHDITLQKLAEQKIENANRELNTFFDVIDDIFFSIDIIEGKLIHISPGCEKIYGYSAAELLNDFNLFKNAHFPEDIEIIRAANAKLANGETVVFQYRILQKNNTIGWVESKIVPGLAVSGKLTRYNGIARDITGRKNAELERQQTEKWYRTIVESAQEGIWTIDENNKTNFVNQKICEILGYSADEMMGKDLLHFMDEEDRAEAILCMERRRNGAKESLNMRYLTKSGNYVWANINANPIFDDKGNYKGALAMVTDITEKRHSEQSLKESEANLRTVFENTDIGFVLFNLYFDIVSFNTKAEEYCRLHFDKQLTTGTNGIYFTPENKKEKVKNILAKVATGEVITYEINYNLPDKAVKWYNITWVGVFKDKKERIGVLLTVNDITERKLLELEREKITADLIERNKEHEQFNYMLSHNLRAPVANINGLIELLPDKELKDEDRAFILKSLSASIKSLDSVIIDMNNVLQYKRYKNETKEIIYLDELLSDIKLSINNIIQKENVVINCHFEINNINTVKSYLYSIMYNLVLNSIKYRKDNVSPIVAIESKLVNNKIMISIADNGKGIDIKNYGGQLFQIYKRFDTSVEGKGLGLYMVKTQVEALGGSIEVNSKLGKGAEFTVILPA